MPQLSLVTDEPQYPRWLNKEKWEEYRQKRIENGNPMTDRAERAAIRKLGSMIDLGTYTQDEIMDHNLSYDHWVGLFMPDWKK